MRRSHLAFALALSVFVACDSREPAREVAPDVAPPQDARAGWGDDGAWRVFPEPLLEIGVLEGDDAYQLFDVSAAAVQSDGGIVIADVRAATVRLYGADGSLERTLGTVGSGPGEFRRPEQIVIQAADSILVWDADLWRISKFDASGKFVGDQTFRPDRIGVAATPPLYPGSGVMLPQGEVLVRLVEKTKAPPTGGSFRPKSGALRVSQDLSSIDTLAFFPDADLVSVPSIWGPLPVVPPLARNTLIASQPRAFRVCLGDQARAEVRCTAADGESTVVRWRSEPVPVRADDPDVAAWRRNTLDDYLQKLSEDDARRLVDRVPIPALRPEFTELMLDSRMNLWVGRGPTDPANPLAAEFLVFDEAGRLRGPVAVPAIRVLEIGEDYILGVRQDDLDVQYVQLFRLDRAAS